MPTLDAAAIEKLLGEIDGWQVRAAAAYRPPQLAKGFEFRDFAGAIAFVDRMAALAEAEGHHPDFCVHYSRVDVTLWTHAVGGLSENDFILAAKIDGILP
jgi:4a-hydroxytetrahydrobiopterin dehydratase